MLGLSIGKLLLTAAVIAVVIYGWKWINRVQTVQSTQRRRMNRDQARKQPPAVDAVDMAPCPACGDYVPTAGARSCGREDCPYPG